MILILYMMYII